MLDLMQPGDAGGRRGALVGRHGWMKPVGKVRGRNGGMDRI